MKFAKVMFLHLSVSHSVHWGGVPRQVHPLGQVHPPGRYTPWQVHTPPGKYPHGQVHPPGEVPPPPPGMYATQGRYTTPPRHVCPPGQVHHPSQAGTPRACKPSWVGTPRAGTPPAMHAGIWSTSSRYTSYWNAFLLTDFQGLFTLRTWKRRRFFLLRNPMRCLSRVGKDERNFRFRISFLSM